MEIKSIAVTMTGDDLRVLAPALRLYHRTCIMSADDEQRVMHLIHLAERAEEYQGKCYAEVIKADTTNEAPPSVPAV